MNTLNRNFHIVYVPLCRAKWPRDSRPSSPRVHTGNHVLEMRRASALDYRHTANHGHGNYLKTVTIGLHMVTQLLCVVIVSQCTCTCKCICDAACRIKFHLLLLNLSLSLSLSLPPPPGGGIWTGCAACEGGSSEGDTESRQTATEGQGPPHLPPRGPPASPGQVQCIARPNERPLLDTLRLEEAERGRSGTVEPSQEEAQGLPQHGQPLFVYELHGVTVPFPFQLQLLVS